LYLVLLLLMSILEMWLLRWGEIVEIASSSIEAIEASTTFSAATTTSEATPIRAILKVTIELMLIEVARLIVAIGGIGAKVTWIVILWAVPHIVVLTIPASSIHSLIRGKIHAHVHAVHPIHVRTRTAESAEHAL
jgi:hypothetical protein